MTSILVTLSGIVMLLRPVPQKAPSPTSEATEHYLQYFPTRSTNAYRMPSGETVPEEQIKPWFAKQADKPHYKPAVISIKISNIRKLRASVAITEIGSKLQALGDDMAKDEITKMFEADGLW